MFRRIPNRREEHIQCVSSAQQGGVPDTSGISGIPEQIGSRLELRKGILGAKELTASSYAVKCIVILEDAQVAMFGDCLMRCEVQTVA